MMIMWKPKYFHEMITKSVIITRVESPSQSWMSPSRPTRRQRRVDDRVRLQHQREDDAGHGLRQDVRQEEQQAEDRPTAEAPIEQHRERKAERDLDEQREHDDQQVVADRGHEGLVAERGDVVLEADEVGQRREAVPLVEAVLHRLQDRQDDEDGVQDQGRQHEQPDREPPGRESRAPARGAAQCRHRSSSVSAEESSGPAKPARCSSLAQGSRPRGAYWVAAASVSAWQTSAGVDSPRNSAIVASLKAWLIAPDVAWSR